MTAKWAEEKAREITKECVGLCDCEEGIAAALEEAEARGRDYMTTLIDKDSYRRGRDAGLEEAAKYVKVQWGFWCDSDNGAEGMAGGIRALKSGAAREER
jgi:hypothetical protein